MVKLRNLAHARSGDKGNDANIGVIANNDESYKALKRELTSDKVQAYFSDLGATEVIRYELPNILAFNFVLKNALGGGAGSSLRTDSQGKVLAEALLEMEIDHV